MTVLNHQEVTRIADALEQRVGEDHHYAARFFGLIARHYLENRASIALDKLIEVAAPKELR